MKKTSLYISLFVILFGFSFAGVKNTSTSASLSGQFAIFDGQNLLPEEIGDQNYIDRKRAHKRKRQIRPRRNGF